MASLYKRGLYWWIRLTEIESKLLEKPKGISTKIKSKRKSEILLKVIKDEIVLKRNANQYLNNSPIKNLLFSEVLEKYIKHKKKEGEALSEKTISIYDKALKRFYKVLEDKLVTEYTKEDYDTFVDGMSDVSQNTRAMYTTRISALFKYLVNDEYLIRNNFRTVKEEEKVIKIIPKEKHEELLEYAKGTIFYDKVMLMYLGAFRANEALSITYSNIKEDSIKIIGKGGKYGEIPITNEMRKFLETKPDLSKEFRYASIRQFFSRASKKLKYKILSHDMRRYQLSRMANKGVNIYFVKNYARHSNIKTTLKYYVGVDLKKMQNEIDQKLLH